MFSTSLHVLCGNGKGTGSMGDWWHQVPVWPVRATSVILAQSYTHFQWVLDSTLPLVPSFLWHLWTGFQGATKGKIVSSLGTSELCLCFLQMMCFCQVSSRMRVREWDLIHRLIAGLVPDHCCEEGRPMVMSFGLRLKEWGNGHKQPILAFFKGNWVYGEEVGHPEVAKGRATAPTHRMERAEVVQVCDWDASWAPPLSFLDTSNWEETSR